MNVDGMRERAARAPGNTMHLVTSKDGASIAYFTSGRGPPLLLVHGTTADHTRWAPILPALERHLTVHAMDRRGRGASGDAPTYAIEREHEDVAAVVDAIAAAAGGPVFLLGHSYGAVCSLDASLLTSNVKKLVLYEPPIPAAGASQPVEIVTRLATLLAEGKRDEVVATFFREVPRISPADLEALRARPNWPARVAAAHTIAREVDLTQYRFQGEKLAEHRVPTLLLLGGASPPMFKAAIDRIHAALPRSEVVVLPGQRHQAMDTAPELFVAEVERFLID